MVAKKGDWTQALRTCHMYSVPALINWAIIVPKKDEQHLNNFVRIMDVVGKQINFKMEKPFKM